MKAELLLQRLESIADELGVKVSYETLAASVGSGGLCRVKGQFRVIVDKRATTSDRVATLASALSAFDTSKLDIAPAVRDALRLHEGRSRRSTSSPARPIGDRLPVGAG